jgi:alpha-beta hydrolase superfamily lysophospholipase
MGMALLKRWWLIGLVLCLSACTSVFFYPNQQSYFQPEFFGLDYEVVEIVTSDGVKLRNWWLKPQSNPQGVVFFLHGNAENISSHIASVAWLPAAGYGVFMLEYRGFGQSEGQSDVPGILRDINAGMQWLGDQEQAQHLPRYLLGQSVGATLAAYYAGVEKPDIEGLILDAPFTGFRDIAREKLASWWLSWPFQYPLSWLVPAQYSVLAVKEGLANYSMLLFHSKDDVIVPGHHGQSICIAVGSSCRSIEVEGPHISTFSQAKPRQQALHFMAKGADKRGLIGS